MTNIAFWSDGHSGCAYYRCDMPARALMARGHGVVVTNLLSEMPDYVDVLVGQRVAKPGPTQGWRAAAATGRYRMVYEVDDDLFNVDPSNKQAWPFFSQPEIRANIVRNIEIADLVIASTEPLAEVLSEYNPNITVIPNSIPQWLLDLPSPASEGESVVVGWSGGASHAMDWKEAMPAIAPTLMREANTIAHFMGWYPPEAPDYLPKYRRRGTSWIESVPEFYRAIDFDIGLAPLREHVFNRSKSHIKTLEYAALGIPVIASDVGPYSNFVRHKETGFLVRQSHEWRRYLRQLIHDSDMRKEIGEAARKLAAGHTIETNIELWEKALA